MEKTKTNSLQVIHMNDHNYMLVHNRMYTLASGDSYSVGLFNNCSTNVSIEVTEDVFNSFVNCELSFGVMLMLYTSLCVKYGKIQVPF